jgi:hypothetical protein
MKRMLSSLFISLLTISYIIPAVLAAPGDLTFTVDVTSIGPVSTGDYIEVPIKVSDNPGISSITGLKISWSSDQLMYDDRLAPYDTEVTSAARATWPFTVPAVYLGGGIFEGIGFSPPGEGTLKLADSITFGFAAMENSTINGTLVTLKFKVKDTATGTIDLDLSLTSANNQVGTELAFNLVGASIPADGTTTPTAPNAPTIGNATAGNTQATVRFTPPANDGGSAITSYTITANPGNITRTATSSPFIFTGLTNGTAYTFTATATNAIGISVPSAVSNSVTPTDVPPTGVNSLMGYAVAMLVFLAISAVLCGYILCQRRAAASK